MFTYLRSYKMTYKLAKSIITGEITSVIYQDDTKSYIIPFAPDNTDYQAYLKWLDEGNTPLPADE